MIDKWDMLVKEGELTRELKNNLKLWKSMTYLLEINISISKFLESSQKEKDGAEETKRVFDRLGLIDNEDNFYQKTYDFDWGAANLEGITLQDMFSNNLEREKSIKPKFVE